MQFQSLRVQSRFGRLRVQPQFGHMHGHPSFAYWHGRQESWQLRVQPQFWPMHGQPDIEICPSDFVGEAHADTFKGATQVDTKSGRTHTPRSSHMNLEAQLLAQNISCSMLRCNYWSNTARVSFPPGFVAIATAGEQSKQALFEKIIKNEILPSHGRANTPPIHTHITQ